MAKHKLSDTVKNIEKSFGKGAIMLLGGENKRESIEFISTNSMELDEAIGIGGLPKGKITEIYGSEGSGKTTLALEVVANIQKEGGGAAYIDVEHGVDPFYAKNIGVNVDDLLISQPDSAEEALKILECLIEDKEIDIVVVDSVAALVPLAELDGNIGDAHMALQARLLSQTLRGLNPKINKTNTTVIFINQIRSNIGVSFGSTTTTPGGRALRFYATVRLDIARIGRINVSNETIGNKTRVKVVKNKVGAPFKQAEFDLFYGKGLIREAGIFSLALKKKIIQQSGAWFSYNDENIGQGQMRSIDYLIENPKVAEEILKKIKARVQ